MKWIIISIVAIAVIIFVIYLFSDSPQRNGEIYIHDTTVVTKYINSVDTQTKFLERFIVKESKPEIIYYDRVDSVFIERTKDMDLMLGLEKRSNKLRVFAVNQNDSLLKEVWYDDVGNNFTAYSANDRIHVESQLWYFNGVNVAYQHKRPVNDLKTYEQLVDVTTGINFKNKYFLNIGAEYNVSQKDIKLKVEIKLRLF